MPIIVKKSLAIFSLTSCEGCQFEILSHYDKFGELLKFYDVHNFRLGQEENQNNSFDVSLVEGSPEGEKQIEHVKEIRKTSKFVIAIGACAHLGGIQSQRNRLPKKLIDRKPVIRLSDIIRVDYTIPGCPINQSELIRCLIDAYHDRVFNLPDLAVCFECRNNENKCLIKNGKPCLGPITRAGCNSICVNHGEACLGCRGPIEQANLIKIKELLKPMLGEEELENWLTFYGDYQNEFENITKKSER